jgi:hypothetical protein
MRAQIHGAHQIDRFSIEVHKVGPGNDPERVGPRVVGSEEVQKARMTGD